VKTATGGDRAHFRRARDVALRADGPDESGEWIQTRTGMVWKPKTAEGWAPIKKGRWRYLEASGYTWVSDDSWDGCRITMAVGRT